MHSSREYYSRIAGNHGFTFIELMISLAIVGILAVIAAPSYISHTQRAKFSEVIRQTSPIKLAVELCAQTVQNLEHCKAGQNGIPQDIVTAGFTDKVEVGENGVITALAVNDIGTDDEGENISYTLTPNLDPTSGLVTWLKGGTCTGKGMC